MELYELKIIGTRQLEFLLRGCDYMRDMQHLHLRKLMETEAYLKEMKMFDEAKKVHEEWMRQFKYWDDAMTLSCVLSGMLEKTTEKKEG